MAQQITYSARFKRDYVAASAVVIFFAIVLAEIALAISIPAYLRRENAMALEVRRLQLLESFDQARNMSDKLKVKGGEVATLEARLVAWGLNTLAPYLRENADKLSGEELASLQDTVTQFTRIMTRLRDVGSYCSEQTLDTGIYVDGLIPETEAKK
ncbi:MAG: hypothetical protein LBM70_00780 [Victivallales bacterium]|nr:hypothetical protein [Victivallales bacterium]